MVRIFFTSPLLLSKEFLGHIKLTQAVYCTFEVIVSPKRTKGFKWTVNIEHATLEGLKNSIRAMYQTPALEMMERYSTC
jgi:hypothetical protein